MISFKKLDILFFLYLIISSLFIIFGSTDPSQAPFLLMVSGLLLLLSLVLIIISPLVKSKIILLLRDTYPLIFSGYFYSNTVHYNKSLFSNIDPYLENLDQYLFGLQPSIEFSEVFSNKLFSELMYFSYFSFYLIILSFVLVVYFKKKEFFKEAVFKLTASLYIFYLIFILIPSAGPQFYYHPPQSILPDAYLFGYIMHFVQEIAEQPTGAFPSSHVGVSFIILLLARKTIPKFYRIILPVVLLLFMSTVYIKAHWLIDVIGGLLFAPIVLYLSIILYSTSLWKRNE